MASLKNSTMARASAPDEQPLQAIRQDACRGAVNPTASAIGAVEADHDPSIRFAGKEAAEKAIVMFSRIEECGWVRAMLACDSYDRLGKANLTTHG